MVTRTCQTPGTTACAVVPWLVSFSLVGLSGCGNGENSAANQASAIEAGPSPAAISRDAVTPTTAVRPTLPVAAISSDSSEAVHPEDDLTVPIPEKGTPGWMLREIARIRTELPSTQQGPLLSDKALRQHEKIIELARLTIAATHQDAQQAQLFNNAVHYLSDSRLALAMNGDTEQTRLLVEDAESLYRRDRSSFSAVESAHKVVQLAQRKAEVHGREQPEWLTEFANQARLFAEKFPQEPNRSALVLLTAGKLCDREGMTDPARSCFTLILKQFPDSVFAEQVHGFLRRYALIGQPLELAGPTIDGGYVSIDDYDGQPVLIVFWAAASPQFQQECERLLEIQAQFQDQGLHVIGVNLDVDEPEIDRFLGERALSWPHIFYSEPEKRGGRHPLARYYGVQRVPTYWIVDRAGNVVAAPADPDELDQRLPEVLNGN
ncbi:MAG: redoxin domain-containing protein [Planctomycetaceae bacterium]